MKFIQVSFLELRLNLSKIKEGKKKKKQRSTTPQEKKKKQHKNKALQDTEADGACQHLLQQEKKKSL